MYSFFHNIQSLVLGLLLFFLLYVSLRLRVPLLFPYVCSGENRHLHIPSNHHIIFYSCPCQVQCSLHLIIHFNFILLLIVNYAYRMTISIVVEIGGALSCNKINGQMRIRITCGVAIVATVDLNLLLESYSKNNKE